MKQFELKKETRIMTVLNRFFDEATEQQTNISGDVAKLTPDNSCLVVAKSERAKYCLSRFIEKEAEPVAIPNIKYGDNGYKARFCEKYFLKIARFFSIFKDDVELSLNQDTPLTAENEDFKIILAPRVD